MTKPIKQTVGILGLGQMGGSFAWALKKKKAARHILGYDLQDKLANAAIRKKIIDGIAVSAVDLIEKSQIVILALPVDTIIELLISYNRLLYYKKLVVDLGSVRSQIRKVSLHIRLTNHIGIHPVCGSALRGQSAWNPGIYDGSNFFFFTENYTSPGALALAKRLVKLAGGKHVTFDYRKHDSLFAITSGLPHILAFSLAAIWQEQRSRHPAIMGPSFTSATRISSSDPEMIAQILYSNRVNLVKAIVKLEAKLGKFKNMLLCGDSKLLARTLRSYGKKS